MKKVLTKLSAAVALLFVVQMQSCKKDTADNDPKIQTLEILAPSPVKVTFKGNIIGLGNSAVLDHGFIYNSLATVDEFNGTEVSLGANAQQGDFSKEVNGLTFNNPYSTSTLFARAYLTNVKGTVYGKVISVSMPVISASSLTPQTGKSGDQVTITGQFFTSSPDQVSVSFSGVMGKVIQATESKIVVEVPSGINASHGSQISLAITIGGQRVNSNYYFTIQANIKDYSPKSGPVGSLITFSGDNMPYYYSMGNLRVLFGQADAGANYNSSNIMQLAVPMNVNAEKVQVSVVNNGQTTVLPGEFTVTPPTITSISPSTTLAGGNITISGTNFPTSYSYGTNPAIMIGNTNLYPGSLSNTAMSVNVPSSLSANEYTVSLKVGPHTVTAPVKLKVIDQSVSGFSPTSGAPGREINISGNFLSGQYYNVAFGSVVTGANATSATNIRAYVPGNIDAGKVKISVQYGEKTIPADGEFTIIGPSIDSFAPTSGVAGAIITINGAGFNQYYTTVRFGSIAANIVSVTDNQIKVAVPSNLNTGAMKITVVTNGQTVVSTANFTATN